MGGYHTHGAESGPGWDDEHIWVGSGNNTYTLYDEAGHWVGDYNNAGTPLQQAIWMDDLPVGLRTAATGALTYIEPDHLGSPRVVIEPVANNAIWKWDLKGEAFGATAPEQDPDANGTIFNLDLRFPGQRYDAASGLNQNGFRDYDPAGRYVQSDPIGLSGGISTYGYAFSSPLMWIDPDGLQMVPAIPMGSGMTGAAGAVGAYNPNSPNTGGLENWGPKISADDVERAARLTSDIMVNVSTPSQWLQSINVATTLISEIAQCQDEDIDCAKHIRECSALCADSSTDFDRPNVYGGSMSKCMRGCLPVKCGGNPT